MIYLHVQQLQSDGELKIHKVSTKNNPSDLMTKYLETAKIENFDEKHKDNYDPEEAIQHQDREERRHNQGSDYKSTERKMAVQTKVEEIHDLTEQQHFAEEAAREDDIKSQRALQRSADSQH
eukprot:6473048-Amphidinium_carterae.1